MNRMSLLFAALLAVSFAMPSHIQDTSQAGQRPALSASHTPAKSSTEAGSKAPVLQEEAQRFLSDFLNKGDAFTGQDTSHLKVLFATLADPVQTHMAAAFDHDLAALQDGVLDSGYLFDSSWIHWELPSSHDSFDDKEKAEALDNEEHRYPGILLFRKGDLKLGENPYAQGLIVFLLAEKPTAGIDIDQAKTALQLLVWAAQQQTTPPKPGTTSSSPSSKTPAWAFPDDTALILGPTYSGSLDSLVPLVNEISNTARIRPPSRFLMRSSDFTSCPAAKLTAQTIADKFKVRVDMGSADYAFDWWIQLALDTLDGFGIPQGKVAVLSEGESLYGGSENQSQSSTRAQCCPKPGGDPGASKPEPWKLEFPREISALRLSYEQQGVLDNPSQSETWKRSLHIGGAGDQSGDSIRTFGGDETIAAQESVLFGISEFVRSHAIHAVIIVATSEEDSYFLTRFLHAHNAGVRVVVIGSSRLFMRGSTAQFRGDMMVGSFPLLPRLYDWTDPNPPDDLAHDQTEHVFPNDSSQGEYIAARDLLWEGDASLPREYSSPVRESKIVGLKPSVYISALGGGAAWPIFEENPVAELEKKPSAASGDGVQQSPTAARQQPNGNNGKDISGDDWRLSMPFLFGDHPFRSAKGKLGPEEQKGVPYIRAGGFWKLTFYLCTAVPLFYCLGVLYSDPVRRRHFAYLQPATQWPHWILLVTVPALLSESSYLIIARQVSFPGVTFGDHGGWWLGALGASLAVPLSIVGINWWRGCRPGNPLAGQPSRRTVQAKAVFVLTIDAIVVWFAIQLLIDLNSRWELSQVLNKYREMHWESGLSLVPTILLMMLAIAVWNYGAQVGISVLEPRPLLPNFSDDERVSDKAGKHIADAGKPFPSEKDARWYWKSTGLAVGVTFLALLLWPDFRAITSLSSKTETMFVFGLAVVAAILMLMDILQFAWLWNELHDLLLALERHEFKRSFVPLRDFNWKNIWTFSAGSFQERRKVLAAQVDCAFDLAAQGSSLIPNAALKHFREARARYSKLNLDDVDFVTYRNDLKKAYRYFRVIGSNIAGEYSLMLREARIMPIPQLGPAEKDPFRDEEQELKELPQRLCLCERFLCLLYIGFIRAVIARLRSLAISIVSVFSLIALGMAVYPFQPMQPLFVTGAAIFVFIGVVMFVVFSQMDKDRILARILESDPNKLEWSFYSKYIDALALPLLTLLSSLLPGGAGRLIDLLRTSFSHVQ